MGIALIKNCDVSFRCVMGITSTLKKMSQIYNTHRKSNSDTIPTKTFNPLWIQQFIEMGIALMISFCSIFFLLYMRKIYLHLQIQCVIRIALCISFFICNSQYAEKAKTFHQCTTTQVRANIFEKCSMDSKDKGFGKMLTIIAYCLSKSSSKHTEDDVSNLCWMSAEP